MVVVNSWKGSSESADEPEMRPLEGQRISNTYMYMYMHILYMNNHTTMHWRKKKKKEKRHTL